MGWWGELNRNVVAILEGDVCVCRLVEETRLVWEAAADTCVCSKDMISNKYVPLPIPPLLTPFIISSPH